MRAYILATEKKKSVELFNSLRSSNVDVELIDSINDISSTSIASSKFSILVVADDKFSPSLAQELINSFSIKLHIFILSDKISPSDYKLYSRIEGLEITDWDSVSIDVEQFIDGIQKQASNALTPQGSINKQIVVTFVGVGSGSGNTTIAMETGIDLSIKFRNSSRGRVSFLDLDLNGGPVCDYLNISPRLDINEIALNPSRLDGYMLEIMTTKHQSGLDVFSSKSPYQNPKYNSSDITLLSLLNCVVDNYSVTIIDIPNRTPLDCSEILKNSDLIIVTGIFGVSSAKRIKSYISGLVNLGISKSRIQILVTDTDTNLLGKISPRFNIESVFKGYNVKFIRRDREFALECADAGVSMIQTDAKKGICRDIQAISDLVSK